MKIESSSNPMRLDRPVALVAALLFAGACTTTTITPEHVTNRPQKRPEWRQAGAPSESSLPGSIVANAGRIHAPIGRRQILRLMVVDLAHAPLYRIKG